MSFFKLLFQNSIIFSEVKILLMFKLFEVFQSLTHILILCCAASCFGIFVKHAAINCF